MNRKTKRRKSSLSSENDGATNHWGSAIKAVRLWPSVNPRTISDKHSDSIDALDLKLRYNKNRRG